MSKRKVCTGICMMLACSLLTSCGIEKQEKEIPSVSESTPNNVSENVEEIKFQKNMTEIEDGFSYVEYVDGYGFEDFIKQGGASSDSEVLEFLASNMFVEAGKLSMANEAFGCSTIAVESPEGEQIFGRNFDWNRCDALVVRSVAEEGYSSISTVNMDFIRQGGGAASSFLSEEQMIQASLYAPLDGMNEKGLSISVNMISDGEVINQNTSKPDLTTTTSVRYLLNHAATTDEAIEFLEKFDLHSSMGMMTHFALSDATGKSVVVEYIDNRMHVTKTPVVTNFYLTEGEKYGIGTEQSRERYDILMDRIRDKLTMTEVADALNRVSKHNFNDSSTTEWSAVFNQTTKEAVYYHRENYGKGYLFSIVD